MLNPFWQQGYLSFLNLSQAQLHIADLYGANLAWSNLGVIPYVLCASQREPSSQTVLRGAHLEDAHLEGAHLEGAHN